MTTDAKLKVLYIAGNGRSGSTLLDIILGQVPGFFPVGEVRNVWDYGVVENRPCGCGRAFDECETWGRILKAGFGADAPDPAAVAAWRERFAQTKRLLPMLANPGRYDRRADADLDAYLRVLERLYHSVARETGSRVVVDSSKWPTYAFLLDRIPGIDLHVLHLVRDPRACAFSWTRRKEGEPGRLLDQQGSVYTTAYWVVWNPVIRHLWKRRRGRYRFLRYEDFVRAPRETAARILEFVGEDPAANPFTDDVTVNISPTHTIEGNFTRFLEGDVKIRADHEWRDRMPAGNRLLVTAMTWPFLWKYGYWR